MPTQDREVLRTYALPKTVHVADREIEEVEFREPTGFIVRKVSEINTRNEHAKRARDITDPLDMIFKHLTGLDVSILDQLPLRTASDLSEIAGELMDTAGGGGGDEAKG